MKLDILAFGAHPDDVEISSGGTILKYISEGKKIGIIDLTKGELGTRGVLQNCAWKRRKKQVHYYHFLYVKTLI